MSSPKEYAKRVLEIISPLGQGETVHLQWNSVAEARLLKSKLTQVQRELRLIKKEVGVTKKSISASYASERVKVGSGFGAGLAAGIFGRKVVGKVNATQRDSIQRHKIDALAPYEALVRQIDGIVTSIDDTKLQIDQWIMQNKGD